MRKKYADIYQNLKEKIECNEYKKGDYLPSEYNLIEEFECSRNTVRRAIAQLAEEGYLQSIHGKGVLIIWNPVQQSLFNFNGIESMEEAAERNSMKYKTKVTQFAEFVVDERLARKTGFEVGSEVYYIQRVRFFDDEALIIDHNWFLKSIVQNLTPEIAEKSVYKYIEEELGITIATTSRKLTVEHMNEIDDKYLDMQEYNCLAVVSSHSYTGAGQIFEYTISRHRPDRFVFYSTAKRNI